MSVVYILIFAPLKSNPSSTTNYTYDFFFFFGWDTYDFWIQSNLLSIAKLNNIDDVCKAYQFYIFFWGKLFTFCIMLGS